MKILGIVVCLLFAAFTFASEIPRRVSCTLMASDGAIVDSDSGAIRLITSEEKVENRGSSAALGDGRACIASAVETENSFTIDKIQIVTKSGDRVEFNPESNHIVLNIDDHTCVCLTF